MARGADCGELFYAVVSSSKDYFERCELCSDGGDKGMLSLGFAMGGLGDGNGRGRNWVG